MNLKEMNKFNRIISESMHIFFNIVRDYKFIDHVDTNNDGDFNHWDTYQFLNTPYRLYFHIELLDEDEGEKANLIFTIETSTDPDLRDQPEFSNLYNGTKIYELKLKDFLSDGSSIDDKLDNFCMENAKNSCMFLSNHLKDLLIQIDTELSLNSFNLENHEWVLEDWLNFDNIISFANMKYEEITNLLVYFDDDELTTKYLPQNVKDIFIF